MTSFYEFLKQDESQPNLALPTLGHSPSTAVISNAVACEVTKLVTTNNLISANDAIRFGQEVASLVTSDKFLKHLSETIQRPRLGETEDEFVERSKKSLLGLIDQQLNSK